MAKKGKADEKAGDDIDLNKPISQAKYARARDLSPPYISKLVKAGKIKLKNGKVIPGEADKARADFADPSKEHRTKKHTPDNGKPGSTSSENSGDEFNDKKVLEELKDKFTAEEIKLLERALAEVPTWNAGQRILSTIKAANELFTYQKERGMVVDAVMVEQKWSDQLSMIRAKLSTVPKKMAHKMGAMVLRYAAKLGRQISDHVEAIKKKKQGHWKYDQKSGAIMLYAGKGKQSFMALGLDVEAPEFAETLAITEAEQALAVEVSDSLNELIAEGEENGNKATG